MYFAFDHVRHDQQIYKVFQTKVTQVHGTVGVELTGSRSHAE